VTPTQLARALDAVAWKELEDLRDELEALRDELIDARRTNDWREQNYALRRAAGVPVAALHSEAVAMVRDIASVAASTVASFASGVEVEAACQRAAAAAAAAARGTEIRVGDTVALLGTETEGTVTDIWNGRLEVCWIDPAAPAAVVVRHRPSELRLVRRAVET